MKTFVQLSPDGTKAHWKFQAEKKPEFEPDIILIDVTNLDPQPEEGWGWDGDTFSPPPEPPPPTAKELALAALPGLREKVIYALARFVAGEITKEQLAERWQTLKGKLQEAEIDFQETL